MCQYYLAIKISGSIFYGFKLFEIFDHRVGKYMQIFGETIAAGTVIFLVVAVGLALFFEAINGFHDTANAVATVIYTHSLKPTVAVVWSGVWNLIGVLVSSGAVAFTIVALLPVELVINVGSAASYAMIFSILVAAIIWNFGTWYLGLPNSSTHALIGSILGVGLANALWSSGNISQGINLKAVEDVFTTLLISPIVGFCCAGLLFLLAKMILKNPELYRPAEQKKAPPLWVRGLLILTCTGVSFSHGNNDGQKGLGLLMLIFIGILPGLFSLDLNTSATNISQLASESRSAVAVINKYAPKISINDQQATKELATFVDDKNQTKLSNNTLPALSIKTQEIESTLSGKISFKTLPVAQRRKLRSDIYSVSSAITKLQKAKDFTASPEDKEALQKYEKLLDKQTKFVPDFIKVMVAFALGIGTMIGWKRIVTTVGEKIGKQHLSYAQGASAELVAMATIGAASGFGLPVSTTHVLSSGVAGTMAASGAGLQANTLRNIASAWVLTLPATLMLGAILFSIAYFIVQHM